MSAWDPILTDAEISRSGATPWHWGDASPVRALVTQTADAHFRNLDFSWFPDLELLYDGRNSLRTLALPDGVEYHGVGVQRPGSRRPVAPVG